MATSGFHVFCGGVLWNDTLLLDNTWPQFTDCFMHTVLIWVPCGFLFLMLPLYVTSVNKQEEERRTFPVTVVNGARLFCCITLATLTLVQLLVRTDEESISMSMAAYLGDALRLAAYILLALMTQYERVKGAQSTAVPFFFWLLTAGCNLIPFYTIIIEQLYTRDLVSFSIFTLSYTLQLVSLGLTACLNHGHRTKYISQTPCPETTCSYPAYLLFWWMTRLMVTGYRRDMEEADLWLLPPSDQIGHLVPTFEQLWAQEQRRCDRANSKRQPVRLISAKFSGATEKTQLLHKTTAKHEEEDQKKASPSLLRVLVKMHMKDIAICHMQKILSDLILLCSPLLLGLLMTFLQERPMGREWQGYVLCVAMFCTIIFKSIFFAHSMFLSTRIGLRIKSTLIAAIYQKALTMNNAAKTNSTVGEIVNMMSVDAQRILDMMGMLFFAITTPVQFIWSIALIYVYVGPSVLVGACVLLLLIPISVYVVSKQQTLQTENLKYKDIRIRLYSEILNGIKVLKLYAWEPSFREKIREVRLKEVALLLKAAMLSSVLSLSWELAPYLVTLAIFATYVLSNPNGYLDAGTAFVSLSVLNLVRAPLSLLSTMIMYLTQAYVSIKRINEFLKNDDLDPTAVTHDDSAGHAISIRNGTFTWDRNLRPTLTNINVEVGEGRLVAVVGTVGCGKSSLISAVLGEMEKVTGTVNTRGRVAYVPQQAWIQNATVRDNILFGKPLNRAKYKRTLDTCELQRDVTILPAGDMTEIGEKGINLSGGQKQRVSVARAVYSDSDVYLLDDPLSAVDSHVGKAIFDKVIGPNGILHKKTRVLVTHGVHWLPMVDEVLVMLDGRISERGSYEELLSHDGPFAQFLKTYLMEVADSEDEEFPELTEIRADLVKRLDSLTSEGEETSGGAGGQRSGRQYSESEDEKVPWDTQRRDRERRDSERWDRERRDSERRDRERRDSERRHRERRDSERRDRKRRDSERRDRERRDSELWDRESQAMAAVRGRLTTLETIEKGKVNKQVFKDYGQAAGMVALTLAFLSFCVFQGLSAGANFWLNAWTGDAALLNASTTDPAALRRGNDFYLGIYGLLGVFQWFFLLAFNYLFWTRMTKAARLLHARLADRILRAPISFFDTTPIGRILNRVSRDMETVDNTLPIIIRDWLETFALVLVTLVVIMIQTPVSGVVLLPVVVLYYFCQGFYVPTARQLKRIESVTRTPIYVLFSETLSGGPSIRAYGATHSFLQECRARVDHNQVYYFASQGAVRWLQFNLDILAAMVVLAASLFAVLSADRDAGDVGLSVSYALQISGTLTWMTRQVCEMETNIVSVERLKEYSELDTEAEWVLPHQRPPATWPETGEVIFNNYQTRYREGLELVLKGVTCTIKHGEKVGIVGRTGAGKSSLTLSLFRLVEAAGGSIFIDGVNIADIGLHDLRSRLTILPQDPVLFSGTLRMNLDPFDEYTDSQLWTALERAHLRHTVTALPGHLDFQCGEEGGSLSVGQRQLVCLARTLLRRTKILVLDEATAAVDMETDDLIQNTIRTAFSACTVITIAHRLNTIMDYDRIMVMDAGLIKEFAPPEQLLANKNSAFYGMARDAGLV